LGAAVKPTILNIIANESQSNANKSESDLISWQTADGEVCLLEQHDEKAQLRDLSEVSSKCSEESETMEPSLVLERCKSEREKQRKK
jgi:hypothetical protein